MRRTPICKGCGKFSYEIEEYREMAAVLLMTPEAYVREYETTMDAATLQFFCTECFMKAGMPVRTPSGAIVRLG